MRGAYAIRVKIIDAFASIYHMFKSIASFDHVGNGNECSSNN
jgi:hypothetical protein